MDFWPKSMNFATFVDFQGKIDVSSMDLHSGLRTNQQFSSFKVKTHTKSTESVNFQPKSMEFVVFVDFAIIRFRSSIK